MLLIRMKIVKTLIVTFLCLFGAIFFAGGGHGTYIFAKIFFPYTMLLAKLTGEISFIGFMFAIVQIPIYAGVLEKMLKYKYYLIILHLFAVILCFYFKNDLF